MCTGGTGAHRFQKRVHMPRSWGSVVVHCPLWVLGAGHWSSVRAALAPTAEPSLKLQHTSRWLILFLVNPLPHKITYSPIKFLVFFKTDKVTRNK